MHDHRWRATPGILNFPEVIVEHGVAYDINVYQCFSMPKPRKHGKYNIERGVRIYWHLRSLNETQTHNIRLEHGNEKKNHARRIPMFVEPRLDFVWTVGCKRLPSLNKIGNRLKI
jgi:hypothetical protein